jgi:predicted ester cyclase
VADSQNKAVVLEFVEQVLNRHDFGRLEELLTPDHVLYHPALTEKAHGVEAYKRALGPIWVEWPDHHLNVQDVVAQGDKVALRAIVTATNTGPARGAKPTNKAVESSVIVTYGIRDGKIASTRVIEDIMRMLHGADLVPKNLTALYWMNKLGVIRLLQKLGKIPGAEAADAQMPT